MSKKKMNPIEKVAVSVASTLSPKKSKWMSKKDLKNELKATKRAAIIGTSAACACIVALSIDNARLSEKVADLQIELDKYFQGADPEEAATSSAPLGTSTTTAAAAT